MIFEIKTDKGIYPLEFCLTCAACPEQYDVYSLGGKRVGYVRLRWGCLRADCPMDDNLTIYSLSFSDDYKGCFDSEDERKRYLKKVAESLVKHCEKEEIFTSEDIREESIYG